MFGEVLPAAAIERAIALAQEAALLLVVGSSLEVWPVAGLPDETLRHGGLLAIVNRDPTPYDGRAALVLHGSAVGDALRVRAGAASSLGGCARGRASRRGPGRTPSTPGARSRTGRPSAG